MGGNRPIYMLALLSLTLTLTVICMISQNKDSNNIGIEKDNCAADFLRRFALYDNRDGKMGPYKLNNPNATDYSETGDKSTRILKHFLLVRI